MLSPEQTNSGNDILLLMFNSFKSSKYHPFSLQIHHFTPPLSQHKPTLFNLFHNYIPISTTLTLNYFPTKSPPAQNARSRTSNQMPFHMKMSSNTILSPLDPTPRHNWVDPDRKESATLKSTDNKGPFLYFYTRTCRFCDRMGADIEKINQRLIETTGKSIETFDIQGDPMHMMAYERYASIPRRCFGVPFLYNLETEDFICGYTDYNNLKDFARV